MSLINKEHLLLEADRIILRPMRTEDINDDYVQGLNDPDVNQYLFCAKVQTYDMVRDYVEHNGRDPRAILFGVFLKGSRPLLIGTIRASDVDARNYFANIGICIFVKRYWKKGLAQEALKRLMEYLFNDVGLHYLEAGAYAENINSVSLFERAGFEQVSRIKNKYRFENRFMDVVYLGIVNPLFDHNKMTGN